MAETEHKTWYDVYPDEIPKHLQYEERPLQDYLQQAAEEHPERIAVHFMGKELTYLNYMKAL